MAMQLEVIGTKRALPFLPILTVMTPSLRSTSSSSKFRASLMRRPVVAMSPNKVEQVQPLRP